MIIGIGAKGNRKVSVLTRHYAKTGENTGSSDACQGEYLRMMVAKTSEAKIPASHICTAL
jgi:hypothetical protein